VEPLGPKLIDAVGDRAELRPQEMVRYFERPFLFIFLSETLRIAEELA
jgi:hypothetical protein